MSAAVLAPERLQRLLEVGRSLVSQFDVDTVLDRVLEVARELTGSQYAAIGVLDARGRELERFITSGIDAQSKAAIGAPPTGRGVLGVLISDPRPLRLDQVGAHPRSYGFPPGHPPMTTFLGVPIVVRDEVYGNLYITDKVDGCFTEEDEHVVGVLADWAAIAVDNARAYSDELERRQQLEQAIARSDATVDIIHALGGETDLDRVLELISKRSRALVDARLLLILLVDESGTQLTVSAMAGDGDRAALGVQVPVEDSLTGSVMLSGRPSRVADVSTRVRHGLHGLLTAEHGLLIPLLYRGKPLGVLGAFDRLSGDFSIEDERILEGFASGAATAVATAQQVSEQVLRRSIEASERERARWARELHDETLQEFAALKVLLSSARRNPSEDVIVEAVEQIEMSITGLRHLITELRPAALDDYGLGAALDALVERVGRTTGMDVSANVSLAFEAGTASSRHDPDIENALYRLVQEALTNAARHARAETVTVTVTEDGSHIFVEVRDDGSGFDVGLPTEGFGLAGMRERVELAGGVIEITSSERRGTRVTAKIPSRRRPAAPSG